jgi:dGTPase
VTQVANASEGHFFHNRLLHTLKVAQVGRRIAESLVAGDPNIPIDADVVETASLAHDLGHPPFGHAGESALSECIEKAGDLEGFDGNAQTFRILTRLAVRDDDCTGLNLTRASLAATIKYPWVRDLADPQSYKHKKWGVYTDDSDEFAFAVAEQTVGERSLEAAIMDWADDIAYSVHDLEDFHRAGFIPWRLLLDDKNGQNSLVAAALASQSASDVTEELLQEVLATTLAAGVDGPAGLGRPYDGSVETRRKLRYWTSVQISQCVQGTKVSGGQLDVEADLRARVLLMKAINRRFVIDSPSLALQQYGQRRVVGELFEAVTELAKHPDRLPCRLRDYLPEPKPRYVADCISSLSETEATLLHAQLSGADSGSILSPVLR